MIEENLVPIAFPARRDGDIAPLMGIGRLTLGFRQGFFLQLLAGTLAVSLPVMLALSIGLSYLASQRISDDASARAAANASSAALELSSFLGERQRDLAQISRGATDLVDSPGISAQIQGLGPVYPNFTVIELVDTQGRIITTTNASVDLRAGAATWFAASLLRPTQQSIMSTAAGLSWIMTSPIIGGDTASKGVVVGNIRISELGSLLQQSAADNQVSTEVYVVDAQRFLLYSSEWVGITDATLMQAKGALRLIDSSSAARAGLAGAKGSVRGSDYAGEDVLSGYAPVAPLGWAVISATGRRPGPGRRRRRGPDRGPLDHRQAPSLVERFRLPLRPPHDPPNRRARTGRAAGGGRRPLPARLTLRRS